METSRKRAASVGEVSPVRGQRAKKQRLPSTCEWILREPAYQRWKAREESTSPLLWLHGPPGCGKTFLAQFIIEDIQSDDVSGPTLVYFCDADTTAPVLMQSLLLQLLQYPSLETEQRIDITASAAEPAPGDQSLPLDAIYKLWDTFSNVILKVPHTTLVFDGVDEIPADQIRQQNFDLLQKFAVLARSDSIDLRLFLSSRTVTTVRNAVGMDSNSISVTADLVRDDLERFIEARLEGNQTLELRKPHVLDAILSQAEGNFMWADLAIRKLAEECPPTSSPEGEKQFLECLQNIPASLEDLYRSIFSKQTASLTKGQIVLRDELLRWTLFTVRPMKLDELANAISVASNAFFRDFEAQAIEVCGSLVRVENGSMKPVHHSLREWLLNQSTTQDGIPALDRSSSNLVIAKTLLTYLSHPTFASTQEPLEGAHFTSTHPLVEYASLYWVYHVSNAARDTSLQASINQFFTSGGNWVEWAHRLLPHFLPLSKIPIPPRPFNTARFFHLFSLKGLLVSYFDEPEKTEFATSIEEIIRSTYERFVTDAQHEPGPETLQAAQCLLDLSEVYSWLPKYKSQALGQVKAASFIVSKSREADAQNLSITVSQALADEYKRGGKYKDAQTILEALLLNDQLLPKDPRRMFALDSLGWVNMRLGDMAAAQMHLEQAKNLAAQIYGSQSPMTLRSKVTLAEILGKLGRHDEAEALCAELKEQLRQHRDNGVPLPKDSISHLNTLAGIFMLEGKYEEAKSTFQVVVDDRRRMFGSKHGMTLWAEMQLGIVMQKAGDQKGARELLETLLPRQIDALGESHPDVKRVKDELKRS